MDERFLDEAPKDDVPTDYDRAHMTTYLRLLDAEMDGAAWEEVCEVIFGLNPITEPARAQAMHASHLARAHWLRDHGYRNLLY
jgi:hypothetical protein